MRSFSISRGVIALLAAMVLATTVGPSAAQDGPTNSEIESIRQERREAQEAASDKAKEVNGAEDDLELVTAALVALQASVNAQESRAADAQRKLIDAEIAFVEAQHAVEAQQVAIEELREQLVDRAILSFVNRDNANDVFAVSRNATQAVRMQTLVDRVTQNDVDVAEVFRAAEEDLAIQQALAEEAAGAADVFRVEAEDELAKLEVEEQARAELTAEAEVRLNALLAEQDALRALEASLGAKEEKAVAALAAELARKAAAPPSGSGGPRGPVATPDEIVNAGNGIWVHESIVGNVQRLLADAAAAGVALRGGGYRDPAGQINVRKNNCGTSEYAIWHMPASQCRPPTARPGTSMHERGKAIDFTYNGRIIGSRSGPAWDWLKANAANYGLYNLPSEPWHWSTTGG